MSFKSFSPGDDTDLSEEESKIIDSIFGEDYSENKCENKNKDCFYDGSAIIIVIAIILTLIFILLACPTVSTWFSCHVPDPYFNLLTRALVFFLFIFIVLIFFEYYYYRPKHAKKHD